MCTSDFLCIRFMAPGLKAGQCPERDSHTALYPLYFTLGILMNIRVSLSESSLVLLLKIVLVLSRVTPYDYLRHPLVYV